MDVEIWIRQEGQWWLWSFAGAVWRYMPKEVATEQEARAWIDSQFSGASVTVQEARPCP